ncbi:MAG: hypothetical protein LBH70_03295 [Spirochaetaceae bacterium]|jgi:hypothetical protein|nr:hypothetical protein [Spirochaetaceae bacterium]
MNFGRLFFVLVSLAALAPVSAHTVSFMIVETGLPGEQGASNKYGKSWEDGFFDVFFDAGHIVSNTPGLRLDTLPSAQFPVEAAESLSGAMEGGVDYFVLALLDYREDGAAKSLEMPGPRQISLRLFSVNPFRFIREEKFAGYRKTQTGEDFINAKQAAVKILPYLE